MDDLKTLRENQAREAGELFLYAGTPAGAFFLLLGLVLPGLLVIALRGWRVPVLPGAPSTTRTVAAVARTRSSFYVPNDAAEFEDVGHGRLPLHLLQSDNPIGSQAHFGSTRVHLLDLLQRLRVIDPANRFWVGTRRAVGTSSFWAEAPAGFFRPLRQ
jgi:hypothetical protein